MEFNHSKLKGRIVEKYGTQSAFAKAIGWSSSQISMRMKNQIQFDAEDIYLICNVLDIPGEEINDYFFYPLSSTFRTKREETK